MWHFLAEIWPKKIRPRDGFVSLISEPVMEFPAVLGVFVKLQPEVILEWSLGRGCDEAEISEGKFGVKSLL